MKSQEKVWNEIAPEWHEFKKMGGEGTNKFLAKCKGNVLDLGSGSGRHLVEIKNGKIWLVDFSEEMLRLAKEKAQKFKILAEFVKSDLIELNFSDNFFDYAICISALHCIEGEENRLKAVKELYRVMKKGGVARIGVWNFQSKRFNQKQGKEKLIKWTNKGERYYYLFDEQEVHDLFKKVGFKIVETDNSEMMINFVVKK